MMRLKNCFQKVPILIKLIIREETYCIMLSTCLVPQLMLLSRQSSSS